MTRSPDPRSIETSVPSTPSQGLALTLSLLAGLVDVTSFVLLNGAFAAHITGNIVVLSAAFALGRPVTAPALLAIPVFVVVAVLLTVVIARQRARAERWITALLILQALLLVVAAVVAVVLGTGAAPDVAVSVLAVSAMATQNTLLHLAFKPAPSTAVMTGNVVAGTIALTRLAIRPGTAADRRAWSAAWPQLLGFVAGCVVGAAAAGNLHSWAWAVPAILAVVVVACVMRSSAVEHLGGGGR